MSQSRSDFSGSRASAVIASCGSRCNPAPFEMEFSMNKLALVRISRKSLPVALAAFATGAMAAPIDVTALVTDIGAQIAPIVLVGGAVLLVVVSVKAFRWVRSALS